MAVRQPLRAASLSTSLTIMPRASSIMPRVRNTRSEITMADSTTTAPVRLAPVVVLAWIMSSSFTAKSILSRYGSRQEPRERQPGHLRCRHGNHHGDLVARLALGNVAGRAINIDRDRVTGDPLA